MKNLHPNNIFGILLIVLWGVLFSIDSKAQDCVALNFSVKTDCAEEDNINVPIFGLGAQKIKITVSHPTYSFSQESCDPNFLNCNIGPGGNPDQCETIYDDGTNVIRTCIVDNWWRDTTMTIELISGISKQVHYLVLIKKIQDANSWPEFLVLYQDGNLRLIPHPPIGISSVCYGSSVIIGPAEQDSIRPYVEIEKVEINPSDLELFVSYINGGYANLSTSVNRDSAVVDINVNYSTDLPIVTVRSMWVEDGNCDVDQVIIENDSIPICSTWSTITNSSLLFYRHFPSIHNNSSPNIRIAVDKISNSGDQYRLEKEAFHVFPNPSSNTISIEPKGNIKIDVLEIYSAEGRMIERIYSNFQPIDLSDLKPGVYFIKIISSGKSITKRIMKL